MNQFWYTGRENGELKRVPAVFFRSRAGAEPVRDWLKSLSSHGLYEVRTSLHTRVARVIFCIKDGHMVLLHGFVKKTRKTPRADLDLALDRKRMLEATP